MEYKQHTRLEVKRQKALDIHLSFIVEQTEKYSTWLSEGLGGNDSTSMSRAGSITDAPTSDFTDGMYYT